MKFNEIKFSNLCSKIALLKKLSEFEFTSHILKSMTIKESFDI